MNGVVTRFFAGQYLMRSCIQIILAICISGCTPGNSTSRGKDWRIANIHKVVVVCIQGDQIANRHIESSFVPKFRHQGLDAVAAKDLFPATSEHSPKELMELMQKAKADGIMEISYSGSLLADGLPRQVKFKYHSIKGRTEKLSGRRSPLDSALIELIADTRR